jgi:hypothetical protein
VRIVRALAGYPEIPVDFPILVSGDMAINEPAFAWLIELLSALTAQRKITPTLTPEPPAKVRRKAQRPRLAIPLR